MHKKSLCFFPKAEMYTTYCVYLFMNGHWNCFNLWYIVSNAAISLSVQILPKISDIVLLEIFPRGEVADDVVIT
jgi:hypothetical protein